jgi:hypothetical protein
MTHEKWSSCHGSEAYSTESSGTGASVASRLPDELRHPAERSRRPGHCHACCGVRAGVGAAPQGLSSATRIIFNGSRSARRPTSLPAKRGLSATQTPSPTRGTVRQRGFTRMCAARSPASSKSSPSTARTWDSRCAGSRSHNCSCVHAAAACTTPMAAAHRGRLSADSSRTKPRYTAEIC